MSERPTPITDALAGTDAAQALAQGGSILDRLRARKQPVTRRVPCPYCDGRSRSSRAVDPCTECDNGTVLVTRWP